MQFRLETGEDLKGCRLYRYGPTHNMVVRPYDEISRYELAARGVLLLASFGVFFSPLPKLLGMIWPAYEGVYLFSLWRLVGAANRRDYNRQVQHVMRQAGRATGAEAEELFATLIPGVQRGTHGDYTYNGLEIDVKAAYSNVADDVTGEMWKFTIRRHQATTVDYFVCFGRRNYERIEDAPIFIVPRRNLTANSYIKIRSDFERYYYEGTNQVLPSETPATLRAAIEALR
ncbi:MAG TPA: hypothetical protein VGB66_17375 [Longimicrobium sp.]